MILEFGGYGLASVAAFGVDLGLLTLLVKVAGWHYLVASAVSFVAGGVFLYVLSTRFVFQFRRAENRALELSYFIGLGVVGLVINIAAIRFAFDGLGLDLFGSKLCAAACTFGANFLLRRYFLFSRSH